MNHPARQPDQEADYGKGIGLNTGPLVVGGFVLDFQHVYSFAAPVIAEGIAELLC
jgi:hypothetical protein